MKAKALSVAVCTMAFMLFFTLESQAQGCGFATFNNGAVCGTTVTVVTNFGNTYTAFIPAGGSVTFPFLAFTECVASVTVNCATIAQPQPAICMPLSPACAACPRRLCVTGSNSWSIL